MLRCLTTGLAGCLLAVAVTAQSPCSDLSVAGDGSPGTTIEFTVTGAPAGATTVLFLSPEQGRLKVSLGQLGGFSLGLAQPIVPWMMAPADATGTTVLSLPVPTGFPLTIALFGQAVSVAVTLPTAPAGGAEPGPQLGLSFCVSDLESLSIGLLPS